MKLAPRSLREEMTTHIDQGAAARALVLALALSGCSRAVAPSPLAPRIVTASARELAIYRTVAESVYVRSTGQPVAVMAMSLDTACTGVLCQPVAARWGLDTMWWDTAGDGAVARTALADLQGKAGRTIDLGDVGVGHPHLIAVAPNALPTDASDVSQWASFRARYEGAAGVLRFTPVGVDSSGRGAIVSVRWSCGPTCDHTLAVALRADSLEQWRIADMLLIPSRPAGSVSSPPTH
jgi:hypothetical protein